MKEKLEELRGKRVLVTGHTGFIGGWLSISLLELGCKIFGFALPPPTDPSLFVLAGLEKRLDHSVGDIQDLKKVEEAYLRAQPDIVFHLAAQPIVRRSYLEPLETLRTNVMGTAHLLEVIRATAKPVAVVIFTTDKCYENRETDHRYQEKDPLGGYDPYSTSKASAELVAQSYRRSFFPTERLNEHGVCVSTVRAGNAIGGGDYAEDRIVPDCVRAIQTGRSLQVRNPNAVRPWQHVLEPVSGCMLLGDLLLKNPAKSAAEFCSAWNFGPPESSQHSVGELVTDFIDEWGSGEWSKVRASTNPHEATLLKLDITKARTGLGWTPKWNFEKTVQKTVAWYRDAADLKNSDDVFNYCVGQIKDYA